MTYLPILMFVAVAANPLPLPPLSATQVCLYKATIARRVAHDRVQGMTQMQAFTDLDRAPVTSVYAADQIRNIIRWIYEDPQLSQMAPNMLYNGMVNRC